VRTIREIQGAASGVTTTYIAEYYPDRIRITTHLRVHEIGDVWQYVDYDSRRGTMTYTDDVLQASVSIDGVPDSLSDALRRYVMVESTAGTLVHLYEILETTPLINGIEEDLKFFYVDSSAGAAGGASDGTGDDEPAAWGCHGFHIVNLCVPLVGTNPPCANNDPAAEVCCVWQSPFGDSFSVGSSFYPLTFRQTVITFAPGASPDPDLYRSRLDQPLAVDIVAQDRTSAR
jgi:hypothetical protein